MAITNETPPDKVIAFYRGKINDQLDIIAANGDERIKIWVSWIKSWQREIDDERASQNFSNESSALPISDVVKSLPSEPGPRSQKKCFMCGKTDCRCHDKW